MAAVREVPSSRGKNPGLFAYDMFVRVRILLPLWRWANVEMWTWRVWKLIITNVWSVTRASDVIDTFISYGILFIVSCVIPYNHFFWIVRCNNINSSSLCSVPHSLSRPIEDSNFSISGTYWTPRAVSLHGHIDINTTSSAAE